MEGFTPVGIIPPDYECQVCKQVMLEPVILPECGHTYCKSCATRVTNTGPKHCPNCRTPIKSAMITNFTVKTLVLKIRATCNRCQTVEELESLLIHRCPEEELNCSNNGCNEKYKRKDKRAHTDVCQYEIIKCHQCHEDTTGAAKEVHLTQQCKEGRINCPLMCRMRPKRKELQMHISACKERQRECDVPGCHFWGSSMSMEEHRRQRAEKHVSLLLEEREQLHDALFTHDKNYSTRTAETVGSFSWTVDAFKERAAQQGSKNPMTSEEFEIDGKRWRMVLYVRSKQTCKLYLQLRSAVCSPRISIRFIIIGDVDAVYTVDDERIQEGEMFGTDITLDCLEKQAAGRHGILIVKVFVEKINLST